MLDHSVFKVLPSLLSILIVGKDISGRTVRRALAQLLPIILHQRGPAHQLHGGELLQEIPDEKTGKQRDSKLLFMLHLNETITVSCIIIIIVFIFISFMSIIPDL